ncbi:MAG: hypothetical protein Q7K65_05280 [Candidatus Buchananbacteria bacterium]|nr:hypothetical protein [Candidatus Buchananbacteria bacterium]
MNDLQIKAVLAGILFGFWPLLMNRSGLVGNISALAFTFVAGICILPFALWSIGHSFPIANWTFPVANWTLVILAGLFGAFGLLLFNGVLAKVTPGRVSALFVLMIVVQIAVPALYQVIMSGGLTISKGLGFVAAIIAAFLLI